MNMIYLALKPPDSFVLRYHGRIEEEDCLNVKTEGLSVFEQVIVSIDTDSPIGCKMYEDLQFRQLIINEINNPEIQELINKQGIAVVIDGDKYQ